MRDLISRLEKAESGSRELDHAIAYLMGIGVEKERKLWAEMGEAMFVADARGLTPLGRARGDTVRQDWVPGSRGKRGHYKDVLWLSCDGPAPLRSCPAYTTSLDAAIALAEEKLPNHDWSIGHLPTSDDADHEENHNFGCLLYDAPRSSPGDALAHGATAPLAACIALLRALDTEGGEP